MNLNNEKTILVIEDTAEMASIITSVLKNDYKVKVFVNGHKAYDYLIENQGTDLILLDVIMPDIDGFELCKKLKESELTKKIPIIFLTALDHPEDIVNGLKLGAVDYISKPFNADVLKARVNTHIQLKEYQDCLVENINQKDELLLQQSKMATLGEMFENIAHQWKQPLSIISMSCNNIELDNELNELDAEALSQEINHIRDSLEYQVKTIDCFKEFISDNCNVSEVCLFDIVEEVRFFLNSKIKSRSINFNNSIERSLKVNLNKSNLLQILINLVGNSIDALSNLSSENKSISLSNKINKNQIEINICDNGTGIPLKNEKKIFQKYYTTKSKTGGSGLGLYMSKQIAQKKLNGDLSFLNQEKGVCFTISIPVK